VNRIFLVYRRVAVRSVFQFVDFELLLFGGMSGEEDEDKEQFVLKDWCTALNITEPGLKKIELNLVTDLETLLLFWDQDIELLKLAAGDALRFRLGLQKLRAVSDSPPGLYTQEKFPAKEEKESISSRKDSVSPTVTSERVYTQAEVQRLLAGQAAIAAGSGSLNASGLAVATTTGLSASTQPGSVETLSALLSRPATAISEVRELMRDLLNLDDLPLNSRGEKALLPIHYLSCIRGTQDRDEVLHAGKDINLVLQTANKRVTPDKLTAGQWIGANSRILDKFITSGRLSAAQLSDYLEYSRKVGDLLQQYTTNSVFMLDHVHRLEVHEKPSKRWSEIDATLQSSHLKKKDESNSSVNRTSNYRDSNSRDNRGRGFVNRHVSSPCFAYNSPEGCRFTKDRCRYDHVESSGDKSVREKAPRFQKVSGGSSNTS
jgi:hypothetical protein